MSEIVPIWVVSAQFVAKYDIPVTDQVTEFDGVPATYRWLVEHGTQHDMIGSMLSTSLVIWGNHDDDDGIGTLLSLLIRPVIFTDLAAILGN